MTPPPRLPLLIPVVSLVGGISLAGWIEDSSLFQYLVATAIVIIIAAIGLGIYLNSRKSSLVNLYNRGKLDNVWISALFFAAGMWSYTIAAPRNYDFENDMYPPVAIGRVEKSLQLEAYSKTEINVSQFRHLDSRPPIPTPNLKVTLYTEAKTLSPGDEVMWRHGFMRSNDRNENKWHQYAEDDEIVITGHSNALKYKLLSLRDALIIRIEKSGMMRKAADFMMAVTLGYRDNLHPDTSRSFRDGGMSHLLALSGLHVSIIAGILCFMLYGLDIAGLRKLRMLLTVALLWFYIILTGMAMSAIRAGIMASFVIGALLLQRRNCALNALLAAVCVILILSPGALFDAGFQLSATATAAVIIFVQWLNPFSLRRHKLMHRIFMVFGMAAVALISTSLLTAYHFHTFAPASLFGNIIATMLLPIYIVLALFDMILIACSIEWGLLTHVLESAWLFIEGITKINSSLPANSATIWISGFTTSMVYVSLVSLAVWIVTRKKNWIYATSVFFGCVMVSALFLPSGRPPDKVSLIPRTKGVSIEIWHNGNKEIFPLLQRSTNALKCDSLIVAWLDCNELPLLPECSAIVIGPHCEVTIEEMVRQMPRASIYGSHLLYSHQGDDYAAQAMQNGVTFTQCSAHTPMILASSE